MNQDLKKILEDLQHDYLKNMPAKIEMIENLWKQNKIELMETEFHKLKGTGKTYGFPEVTELGKVGEALCSAEPDACNAAVPLALEVLRQILASRLKGQEYDLNSDKEFSQLIALQGK